MPLLPLFPLGTVLLPGGSLPLQIFERRYVVLLNDLLGEAGPSLGSAQGRALRRGSGRSDSAPSFGVVALRRGHEVGADAVQSLFDIGCVARIEAARPAPGPSGMRYHLQTRGTRRFVIESLVTTGAPYLVAEVSYLDEPLGALPRTERLASRVRSEVAGYRRSLGLSAVDLPADLAALAYRAADAAAFDLLTRQHILSASDAAARLAVVLAAVRRERLLIDELQVGPVGLTLGAASPN